MTKRFQVVGIGNAIVDVLTHADDSFLDHMGIRKGIMQLVERQRAESLYGAMKDRVQVAGGSVANTLAGLGNLGLATGFIGRVRDDALGRFYASELEEGGTRFLNPPVADQNDLPTSRSMIFVTPDGERSMNTYLGISSEVSGADVPEDAVADSEILFLEGYLYDKDKGKAAFQTAARACRKGGGKAGIALSDPFCVDRHRADFRTLVRGELDFVIGNQSEWLSLYQANTLEEALIHAAADCPLVVCTRSGESVVLVREGERVEVPVEMVTPVDATGAGDQFAAGFLYGYATGRGLETCGRMGCVAAAEVISHLGARPVADLKQLFRAEGLI
ncbi:adenosine kinase [Halovulum dunhuangense]|uniref:Adenosine kinase n=1 Tax=Halovulum dunhuangense TaxID=1505036 RepID=A0A849KYX8_9RHOB|nr:adenosine kinase [Halovulum dunhuangense]NNU79566.1 adenosine kinase [Halovulum dunhuangense]